MQQQNQQYVVLNVQPTVQQLRDIIEQGTRQEGYSLKNDIYHTSKAALKGAGIGVLAGFGAKIPIDAGVKAYKKNKHNKKINQEYGKKIHNTISTQHNETVKLEDAIRTKKQLKHQLEVKSNDLNQKCVKKISDFEKYSRSIEQQLKQDEAEIQDELGFISKSQDGEKITKIEIYKKNFNDPSYNEEFGYDKGITTAITDSVQNKTEDNICDDIKIKRKIYIPANFFGDTPERQKETEAKVKEWQKKHSFVAEHLTCKGRQAEPYHQLTSCRCSNDYAMMHNRADICVFKHPCGACQDDASALNQPEAYLNRDNYKKYFNNPKFDDQMDEFNQIYNGYFASKNDIARVNYDINNMSKRLEDNKSQYKEDIKNIEMQKRTDINAYKPVGTGLSMPIIGAVTGGIAGAFKGHKRYMEGLEDIVFNSSPVDHNACIVLPLDGKYISPRDRMNSLTADNRSFMYFDQVTERIYIIGNSQAARRLRQSLGIPADGNNIDSQDMNYDRLCAAALSFIPQTDQDQNIATAYSNLRAWLQQQIGNQNQNHNAPAQNNGNNNNNLNDINNNNNVQDVPLVANEQEAHNILNNVGNDGLNATHADENGIV